MVTLEETTSIDQAAEVARSIFTTPFVLDVLTREGGLWVREASLSMLPLIRPGDELRLAPLDPKQVFRGMLVAYQREARLVIHRVVACDGAGVVAKGDALASTDPVVPWDQLVARVVAIRGANAREVDLEAFPWPLLNRLLGAIASLACRLSHGLRGPTPPLMRRLIWKGLRLPFYLVRLLLR